jgi:hypothetical protein
LKTFHVAAVSAKVFPQVVLVAGNGITVHAKLSGFEMRMKMTTKLHTYMTNFGDEFGSGLKDEWG